MQNISDIGEFGLIDHLTQDTKIYHTSTLKGIGDDAAVIAKNDTDCLLISTDLLVEGIHFDVVYTPLKHLGYKAVVVNVSDIVAMNGTATHITVALAISSKYTIEAMDELYKGIALACKKYKIDLVGGDTTSTPSGLVIAITVVGEAKKDKITHRHTAQKGDLICVTGDLGAAYIGLTLLEREKRVFMESPSIQPDFDGKSYPIQRQLKPDARIDMVEIFEELNLVPTAMIDISDGLASELFHLCKQSQVGCKIYEDKLPIDKTVYNTALEFNLDPTVCALNGGEDYELLFTVSQADYEKIKDNPDISVIGYVCDAEEGKKLITKSNSIHDLKAQGWDSFGQES